MKSAALLAIGAVVTVIMAVNLQWAPWLIPIVKRIPGRDLTAHFVLFGVLSLLVNLAFARSRVRGRELGVTAITSVLLVAIALEEYSQKMIPRRDFNMNDLGASVAGALLFAAIAWGVLARTAPRTTRHSSDASS